MALRGHLPDGGWCPVRWFAADAYGPWQFTVFRVVFGAYLAVHFFALAPYAPEVFGPAGMIPDPGLLPSAGVFPNPLNLLAADAALVAAVATLGVLAVAFAVGCARRIVALLLWFGWACLFHRNVFIANPSLPYVGWLLLACAVLPAGEPWSMWPRRTMDGAVWRMHPWILGGAWLLLGAGYTFSGVHKAASESWQNGLAIKYVLELPTARDVWWKDLLLALPDLFHRANTWAALLLELVFLPLCLFRRTRPWVFLAMLAMHTGILLTVSIADLTMGMLVFHLFVVEPDWGIDRRLAKLVVIDAGGGWGARVVGFLRAADTCRVLRVARPTTPTTPTTLVYQRGERQLVRSTALVWAVADLGGVWRLALVLLAVPRPLRDRVYDAVAARLDACPLDASRARPLTLGPD